MFGTLGGPEVILILVIALIVFGPRRLPEIGKSMGKMLAEFRKASNDFKRTIEDELEAEKAREVKPIEPAPPARAPDLTSSAETAPAPAHSPPAAEGEAAHGGPSHAGPSHAGPAPTETHIEPPAEAVVSRGPSADEK